MVEFPVNVKFKIDKGELNKAKSEINAGTGGKGGTSGKKSEGLLGGILGKLGIITGILAALNDLIGPLLQLIQLLVFVGLTQLIKGIMDLGTLLQSLFDNTVGLIIDLAKGAFDFVINWIKDGWEIMKGIGQWIWEKIIKPSWEFLKDVGKWLWDNVILPSWEFLKDVGQWIWEKILEPAWNFLKDVGKWIWEKIIKPSWEFLKDVGQWIWEKIIKPSWEFLKDAGQWIWEQIIKPAFNFLKDIGQWIWDLIKSFVSKFFGGGDTANGGRAFGGVVSEDGLYKLHAGETVSRGNTTTINKSPSINIAVNGNDGVNDNLVNEIAVRMSRELNTFSRF